MDWHPFLVHFPLVFLPLSVGLDLYAWLGRRPQGHGLAYGLLVLGTISALAALLTGTATVGCGLLWLTGYYGGQLVYQYGVGVQTPPLP